MGIVYWHQSVLQVTLLLQIICFYQCAVCSRSRYVIPFLILTVINPYIEWTGYVANFGFVIAELLLHWRINWRGYIKQVALICFLTILSFILFSAHYLLRVTPDSFFGALYSRFSARNYSVNTPIISIIAGYLESFAYLWVLLVIALIICFCCKRSLEINNGILILILAFPILENFVMKQHALVYTYDRMKAAWLIIFLTCEVIRNIDTYLIYLKKVDLSSCLD